MNISGSISNESFWAYQKAVDLCRFLVELHMSVSSSLSIPSELRQFLGL